MMPAIGLFLLRYRVMIASLLFAGLVLYLIGGWPGLLALPFLLVAVLGFFLLFDWIV